MLSDEEKKAIEKLQKENEEYKKAIDVVNKEKADWIRAYQEEKDKIEELKKPKYVINCKTNEITKLTNDFVSKDKIKAKIEIRKEEKENCKDSIEEKYLLREIYVLQSLLEKE